jgi:hypothetical protein
LYPFDRRIILDCSGKLLVKLSVKGAVDPALVAL